MVSSAKDRHTSREEYREIPGLGPAEVLVVVSVLRSAGFRVRHVQSAEWVDLVLVRVSDVPAIKRLLKDIEVRSSGGKRSAIPW
jgi:hypothetical protein